MLYSKMSSVRRDLAARLHRSRGFKFYCFSNLLPEDGKTDRRGLNFSTARLIISSPDDEFIKIFAEGLLTSPEFHLKQRPFICTSVQLVDDIPLGTTATMTTLSPILVRTVREDGGNKKEWELYPRDGKFYDNLHRNLLSRYEEFYGYPPPEDIFEISKLIWMKPKRVEIDGTPRRCSLMTFRINASEALMKFAYQAGLGERQAMGFGCIEVIKDKNATQGDK